MSPVYIGHLNLLRIPIKLNQICVNTLIYLFIFYQLAACEVLAGPNITLCFPRLLVYMCVHAYHVRNNYVT